MRQVDVLIFDGVDELDLCGPLDVLASCRQTVAGRWGEKKAFRVQTVAAQLGPVHTAHDMRILPDKSLAQAMDSDILIIPGGPSARKEHQPPSVLEWITKCSHTAELVCSISSGAFILGRAGLLAGRKVTTHQTLLEELKRQFPKALVIPGVRFVEDGQTLLTSAGITAGIDAALRIIERFEGTACARLAAQRIEWPSPLLMSETPSEAALSSHR
ncbi:MAG TPA: DJ-1/PfpI family protein [Capsulimonadaceae bacterium]|nr:DJ-1/PfpI family protein [Capsulimonadaceae bacterium]